MTNALVLLPAGAPPDSLQLAIDAVDRTIATKVILDGIGGVVDADPVLVQALNALPNVLSATIGPLGDPAALGIAQDAQPWIAAWNLLVDPAYVDMVATRQSVRVCAL